MRSEGREWGVMTWNIHGAAGPDLDELANVVRAEGPDVLALQEVQRAQAVELAQRLGMRFTWARKHWAKTPLLWRRAEGLAIMTPHALDAAGHTEISDGVTSWSYRRRIAQWTLVGRPDRSAYRVYNLHLSPNEMSVERRAEAVRVAEIVAEHGDSPPAIVTGDFNDGADGSVIYALPGIEYEVPPPTSPAINPTEVLDHVLLPDDASHVATSVPGGGPEWAARSDHLPVSARFTIDWLIDDFA